MRYDIDRIVAGIMEEEPSTFSKISNFIFGRGPLKQAADFGSASAGTPSTNSTGSGFAPAPGMGGKSLADLAQDQANRSGIGKTSTVVHKSSSSTSSPPLSGKSSSAPPAVKPVSSAPKISKPLTQSLSRSAGILEYEDEEEEFSPGDKVRLKPQYQDKPGEIFTVGHSGSRANTHWIADKNGRGWYARAHQLIRHEESVQYRSSVSLLVQAVAEGADPRDVLRVAPRIMEAAPPRQEIDPDYSVGRGSRGSVVGARHAAGSIRDLKKQLQSAGAPRQFIRQDVKHIKRGDSSTAAFRIGSK